MAKKGQRKRQNMSTTQFTGCLLTISQLNIHRKHKKMRDECYQFNHRGMQRMEGLCHMNDNTVMQLGYYNLINSKHRYTSGISNNPGIITGTFTMTTYYNTMQSPKQHNNTVGY